jgi:hypothetical protein
MYGVLIFVGRVLCIPLLGALIVLEPVVRIALSLISLVVLLTGALLFLCGAIPAGTALQLTASALGAIALLALYYFVIRLYRNGSSVRLIILEQAALDVFRAFAPVVFANPDCDRRDALPGFVPRAFLADKSGQREPVA